jgi:hypothetical protein
LKEEDRKDEVIKVNEEERSSEEEVIRRMMMTTEEKSNTCQLCLPALSKLEFFSLALRKIALSLSVFPILSS